MKLSYSTWGMRDTPIDVAVRHCAALGFDGLELTVIPGWPTDAAGLDAAGRREIRRLYDEAGIELCGLSGNIDLHATGIEGEVRFRTYLELAAELQRPGERLIVTTTTGGAPSDWVESKNRLVETIGRLAEHATATGTMIGIEPHVGAALHSVDDVIWLVEQIGNEALTIHFDISHFNVQGLEMEEVVAKLAPLCLHTHVKDERGRAPEHEFLIPGEGEMDYVRYLRSMQRAGYDGHIVVEISVMVQARPDFDSLAAATQSWKVLSAAFAEAGIALG